MSDTKKAEQKGTPRIAVFSTKAWVNNAFEEINSKFRFEISYFESRMYKKTIPLAKGFDAVCVFVNDHLDAEVVEGLKGQGIKLIALRCAGFNNVDIEKALEEKIGVVRVPAYSPYAVAEHA